MRMACLCSFITCISADADDRAGITDVRKNDAIVITELIFAGGRACSLSTVNPSQHNHSASSGVMYDRATARPRRAGGLM